MKAAGDTPGRRARSPHRDGEAHWRQAARECRGLFGDRLAQRLEHFWISVLRRVFHELLKRIDERECILTHVAKLGPEAVELGGLCLVEHQPPQVFVFAIEERQGDDLVDRHDLGVAQGRWEDLTNRIERSLEAAPGVRSLVSNDRQIRGRPFTR